MCIKMQKIRIWGLHKPENRQMFSRKSSCKMKNDREVLYCTYLLYSHDFLISILLFDFNRPSPPKSVLVEYNTVHPQSFECLRTTPTLLFSQQNHYFPPHQFILQLIVACSGAVKMISQTCPFISKTLKNNQ